MIEENERRGSSSDSSTCLVGTTSQGLESTTPQNGKQFYLNMAAKMAAASTGHCSQSDLQSLRICSHFFSRLSQTNTPLSKCSLKALSMAVNVYCVHTGSSSFNLSHRRINAKVKSQWDWVFWFDYSSL